MTDAGQGAASASGPLARARVFILPLIAVLISTPLACYAIARSTVWFGQSFPGFFLVSRAVVSTVSGYDWPAEQDHLLLSQVVAVDGARVHSSADVYARAAAVPVGTPLTYTLRRDGAEFTRTVSTMRFSGHDYAETCGILLLFGIISLASGIVVGAMQPRTRQARVYLLSAVVAGLYPITGTLLYQPHVPAWSTAVYLASECFFPATWIHLALLFPIARTLRGPWRLAIAAPYAVSAALLVLVAAGFYGDPPNFRAFDVTWAYIAVAIVFFYGAMVVAYWQNPEPMARPRVKVTLIGLLIATALPALAFANHAFAGHTIPLQFGLVLAPVFYASLAYSIAKHDLFDVDRLVRRSFVYAALTLVLLTSYGLLLLITARVLPSFAAENQTLLNAVFVIGVALALDPLRRTIQAGVDRAFFRSRLNYRATLRELSEVMTTLLDLRDVVGQMTRVVLHAMQLESSAVCLVDPDRPGAAVWTRTADGELESSHVAIDLPGLTTLFAAPVALTRGMLGHADRDVHGLEAVFATLQASVIVPLMFRGRPVGLLSLGPKRSGQPFSSDDLDVLRMLANQTAIAVQNARSYQALADLTRSLDEKVRQQTEALRKSNEQLSGAYDELKNAEVQLVQSEKMASLGRLVAGVAHELNNPASFVHGALANLATFFEGLLAVVRAFEAAPPADAASAAVIERVKARVRLDYLLRETPELLRICSEGSHRIKKVVEDLRVFVRADQGERAPTDVAAGIDGSIQLLGDRIARLGITVAREYEAVPPIEANAAQLNQVWMNLLSNAIDAVDTRSAGMIRVAIRHRRAPDGASHGETHGDGFSNGYVQVEVQDNGVGILPDDRKRILEPFFTTKPIGHGTGLGLSIVYGAVTNHHGTLAVDSERGRGTRVTVSLPVRGGGTPPR